MEEKKTLKISLSTFLLILAIIIIIVMGVFIYKLSNDKKSEINKSTELQAKVSNLNETISDLQGKIDRISETINTNNSNENSATSKEVDKTIDYQISGTYYQQNSQGDEPSYTFSSNNKVTYGALWMCNGTYTIINNTIKITFISAVDPDGNKANVKDFGIDEIVELTIIDDNQLKDNSDGVVYSK